MQIWAKNNTLESLRDDRKSTLSKHLGMEITEIGDDYLTISMPVDARTHQVMGILHGGASVALAETVGSIAGNLVVQPDSYCVGLDINANHISSVKSGLVFGTATPVHLGKSTQVWNIHIVDEAGRTVCVSRLTMAVLSKQKRGEVP